MNDFRNDNPMNGRVVALAAMLQALAQVRQLAENGTFDETSARPIVHSVLRMDSPSVMAIYGNRHALSRGFSLLKSYLQREDSDETLAKMAMTVMQLERNLMSDDKTLSQIQDSLTSINERADDAPLQEIMQSLGSLYSRTVSRQKPSVIVNGTPQYLDRSEIVTEIRALLFGAVRAAVLWRQMGGSMLDFLLRKKSMLQSIESL